MKSFYAHTNKRNATRQITQLQRREQLLNDKMHQKSQAKDATKRVKPTVDFEDSEPLPFTPPENHHHISHSHKFPLQISSFLSDNINDLATKVSIVSHTCDFVTRHCRFLILGRIFSRNCKIISCGAFLTHHSRLRNMSTLKASGAILSSRMATFSSTKCFGLTTLHMMSDAIKTQ